MNYFLDDLEKYLDMCFQNDVDITVSKKPNIYKGYQVQHEPSSKKPEIQIHRLNTNEQVNFTTFCKKNANTISVQITAFSGQMKIRGVEYSAQDASGILGEKIEQYICDYIYSCNNQNIYDGKLITISPTLPMNEGGSIYMTAVRFNFVIAHPYVVG